MTFSIQPEFIRVDSRPFAVRSSGNGRLPPGAQRYDEGCASSFAFVGGENGGVDCLRKFGDHEGHEGNVSPWSYAEHLNRHGDLHASRGEGPFLIEMDARGGWQ